MPAHYVRRAHTRKPHGTPRLNMAHPLARGLKAAYVFSEGRADPRCLGPFQEQPVNTGCVWGVDRKGRHLEADATTDYIQLAADSSDLLPTGDCTIVMGYEKADTTNRTSCAFQVWYDTDVDRCSVHLPWSDGTVYWDYGGGFGNNRLSVGGLSFGDDVWAFVGGSVGSQIWQNGIQRASSGTAISRTAASQAFSLGYGDTIASADLAKFKFFYIFDRCLTPAEIRALHANPWSILEPTRTLIALGGVTNYTLTAEATSYTETGQDANLEYHRVLTAESASYLESGQDANLEYHRVLTAEEGTYTWTGQDAALRTGYTLTAEATSYTETGQDATLLYDRLLTAEAATYTWTGVAASLVYSGAAAVIPSINTVGAPIMALKSETALPVQLTVSNEAGGVTGLTVTVKVRDSGGTTSYLDFADDTFKTSGWTDVDLTLTEVGNGVYASTVDISAITNLPAGPYLTCEYFVNGSVTGVAIDLIVFDLGLYSSLGLTLGKFLALKDA